MAKQAKDAQGVHSIVLVRVFVSQEEVDHKAFVKDKIVLGRDPYADVYLEDAKVSRAHAVIQREDDLLVMLDQSTNGTVVNGARQMKRVLKSGDEITIGRFRILIEIHTDSESSFYEAARASGLTLDIEQTLRSPGDK
jgi:predicted component of type VI protein secretion system